MRRLRGNQQHGEKYHRNCRCMAVAVRAGDTYEPPAHVQQWEQDYQAARKQARLKASPTSAVCLIQRRSPSSWTRRPVHAATQSSRYWPSTGQAEVAGVDRATLHVKVVGRLVRPQLEVVELLRRSTRRTSHPSPVHPT